HVSDERRSPDRRGVEVPGLQVEVLRHGEHADRTDARRAIAVDVLDRQPRVGERAAGALGVDLGHGLVRRPTRGVLVDAGDDRLAIEAHTLGAAHCWGRVGRNAAIAALNSAAFSLVTLCPASSMTTSCAPAMPRCSASARATGVMVSSRPATI